MNLRTNDSNITKPSVLSDESRPLSYATVSHG